MDRQTISIPVGEWVKLEIPANAKLTSDNRNVIVRDDGWVIARRDYFSPHNNATIAAIVGGEVVQTCLVNVVDWSANRLNLIRDSVRSVADNNSYWATKKDENSMYIWFFKELYTSTDGEIHAENKISELPAEANNPSNAKFIVTPLGYFVKCQEQIWKSTDLITWTLSHEAEHGTTLYHMFDWEYDEAEGKVYLYHGEYTTVTSNRHKVYRGIIQEGQADQWTTIKDFYSYDEWLADGLTPTCRHVHTVQIDPYSGWLWVGVGDRTHENAIYYTQDKGETWTMLGGNTPWLNMKYRTLAMWFTAEYVYWNMDTGQPQSVFRIKRADIATHRDTDGDVNDKSELVADLFSGSMWYIAEVKDDKGEDVFLMGQSAEGAIRGDIQRLHTFKELPSGQVEVEEVYALAWAGMWPIEPKFQLADGTIYCYTRVPQPKGLWRMSWERKPTHLKKRWKDEYIWRE